MKSRFSALLLILGVALFVAGCTKSRMESQRSDTANEIQRLYVSTPELNQTRLNLSDVGVDGIEVTWQNSGESSDIISIYDATSGLWQTDFEYIGEDMAHSGEFQRIDGSGTALIAGTAYTAIYPASNIPLSELATNMEMPTQSLAQDISQLNSAIRLSADFTYSDLESPSMVFKHLSAILTVKFTTPDAATKPSSLVFVEGSNVYSVDYSADITGASTSGNEYTTYIAMNPNSGTRSLVFTISYGGGATREIYQAQTTVDYQAGYRYTAPLTTLEPKDIFEIYTGDDLAAFRDMINYGNEDIRGTDGILMDDIDISHHPNWGGIGLFEGGTESAPAHDQKYLGTFDGNDMTITGLTIDNPLDDAAGLFGATGSGAEIKDLTIKDASITGRDKVGILMGEADGATINNVTIDGGSLTGNNDVGSFIGSSNSSSIINSSNSAAVIAIGSNVGGIVGKTNSLTLNGIYNLGEVQGVERVGGLVGQANVLQMVASYNMGAVMGIENSQDIGGVVGTGSIVYAAGIYNAGVVSTISGTNLIGGIFGANPNTSIVSGTYYISETPQISGGTAVEPIGVTRVSTVSELNLAVDAINSTITAFAYLPSTSRYSAGADPTTNTPSLRGEVITITE